MFGLTRQERTVILFLIAVFLFGLGVNFLFKTYPAIKSVTYEEKKIDLNEADLSILMSIPGIKEKLAQRIIEYRQLKGGFRDVEELKEIKGIGKTKYELIKDYFLVE